MVGAHSNVNGLRDLTTPPLVTICRPWLSLATVSLPTKFEVCTSNHYEDMKDDNNVKMGWFGVLMVTQGHEK